MSGWFSAQYRCDECLITWDQVVPREERDSQECPYCAGGAIRLMGAPMVLQRSFPDGTKRFGKLRAENALDTALGESVARGDQISAKKIVAEKSRLTSTKK